MSNPPWQPDSSRLVEAPFSLKQWIKQNRSEIEASGCKRLFDKSYQSDILILGLGSGSRPIHSKGGETFLWMVEGHAKINVKGKIYHMNPDDTILIPPEEIFEFNPCTDAIALTCLMDPKNRSRVGF